MSSSYSSNIQTSLATSHVISKQQDKAKKTSKRQQDNAAKHVAQESSLDSERVVALNQDENANVVHNDREGKNNEAQLASTKNKKDKKKDIVSDIVRDESKGKKINIRC